VLPIASHPLLDLATIEARFARPLGELPSPAWLVGLLTPRDGEPGADAAVRDLLRHGGFKPTGRSKPSSEYLRKAAADGRLGSINVAVDVGNAASLHGGLPISVVDADRVVPPLSVELAPAGACYVFNASGQVIDVGGLVCLCDGDGPCANAVKDAQRTKTDATTTRVLVLVWGTVALPGRTAAVAAHCRKLLAHAGATVA
jgi:DNA/RNA-binding domain of Phe-tRNA-synthetase-like protein